MKKSIDTIERLEIMEEKLGIAVEGAYAIFEQDSDGDSYVIVNGEVHTVNGTKLDEDIEIILTVYNNKGKVISTSSTFFASDNFFMIKPFHFYEDVIEMPAKIRLYPVKS